MYLTITPRAGGRKYLSIVHGYRDDSGKVKKKTIKTLGYLDELEADYPDPIAHFRAVAKEMTSENNNDGQYSFTINKQDNLSSGTSNTRNYGYVAYNSVYHQLEIDTFLKNKQRHVPENFDANSATQLATYMRLIAHSQTKSAYEDKGRLFNKNDYPYEDYYRGLHFLYKCKEDLQLWIDKRLRDNLGRDDSMVYYNITNHCSPTHVIKLGVFTDTMGIPISYELFPCNSNYNAPQHPNFPRIRSTFNVKRILTVLDKPINSDDTLWSIINSPNGDGYIYSMAMHGFSKQMKQFILDNDGYTWIDDDCKVKSRTYSRAVTINTYDGRSVTKIIEEKQVVFFSKKYYKRAKGSTLDGYYVLVTSECNESDENIVNIYRKLWDVESFFMLTKEKLETRPACINVHDFIEIHLLTCYLAYVLVSLLQRELNCEYSINEIMDSLASASCTYLQENLYLFSYYDEILNKLSDALGITFNKRIMSLGDIKNEIGETKK